MTLPALQAEFHAHLLGGSDAVATRVADGERIDTAQRLHIYHHAYRARLLDTLRDCYEKTWAYLGDDAFDAAARAYIEAHAPTERSLRWYGECLPAWLDALYPDDADIGELAAIDWRLRLAFDGPDAPALPLQSLQALTAADWEHVGFAFVPTVSIAPLRFNTPALWHALDEDRAPPPAQRLPEPAQLLIWRKGWQPHFRSLDAIEAAALLSLRGGASFAQTCVELEARFGGADGGHIPAQFLRQWFDDELITGLVGAAEASR